MNALPEAIQVIGQLITAVRLAVHLHESGLSWLAYNLTAVSPHNQWTGPGLVRLMSNPPISYDRWVHLPAWRLHRLVDARALGYVHDAHLAELAVVLVALARVWWLRRRRRALRRAAARAAGWPAPPRLATWGAAPGSPVQRGAGAGGALGGVGILLQLVWFLVRAPFLLVAALHGLAPTSAAAASRTAKAAGEDKPLKALRRGGWLDGAGWPLGKVNGRVVSLPQEHQATHVIVTGPTGTGKSKTQLLPWLFREARFDDAHKASLIVFDPKPDSELTNTTIGLMERAGFRVLVYDPFSAGSLRFNALGLCATHEDVKALIDAWVTARSINHPLIGKPAKQMLTAIALHLRAVAEDAWPAVSLADVARYIADHDDTDSLALAGIKDKAKGVTSMDSAREMVEGLLSPTVAASMAGNDWDAAAFVAVPTVLYVPIAMGRRTSTRPYFVALFTMVFTELTRVSNGLPLKRRVRIIADEFANMSPVPGFSDFISAVRYLNVGVAVATQGVQDIKVMYPDSEWSRIQVNLCTWVQLTARGKMLLHRADGEGKAVAVKPRLWTKGDPFLRRRVKRGRRQLDKRRALQRQLRQQQGLPAPHVIEGPHDGDTGPLRATSDTAITEPLALPVALVAQEDSTAGEEVGHEPMTTAAVAEDGEDGEDGEEEETRAAAAATARREAADLARERRQERASTGSTTPRPRRPYRTQTHICAWEPCGIAFEASGNAIFCSPNCRAKSHYAQKQGQA